MLEETQKVSKSYSLDPAVIAWVMQKAARLTIDGERASDSRVVNEILTKEMELDKRPEELKTRVEKKIKQATK